MFQTALVPLKTGRFRLPGFELTYFDPDRGRYHTLTAPVMELNVTPAVKTAASAANPEPRTLLQRKMSLTDRDILPPKQIPVDLPSERPLSWVLFCLGLATPALAFVAAMGIHNLRKKETGPVNVSRTKAHQALEAAETGSRKECLAHLYQALDAAFHAAHGRRDETLKTDSGRTEKDVRRTAELLSIIEMFRFSGQPPSDQYRDDLLAQTRQMVRKLAP